MHNSQHIRKWLGCLLCVIGLSGCVTTEPYDYSAFETHYPRSILVLPPLNESIEVGAEYTYLSQVTRPLAERGYYVFPVAVIDQLMKENGLPGAAEMHDVSLQKIKEVIQPDAVLYVKIHDWGQKYQLITSTTVVSVSAKLIDTNTGTLLWQGKATASDQAGSQTQGFADMIVAAMLDHLVKKLVDHTPQLAAAANRRMFSNPDIGLLPGPYRRSIEVE